MRDERPGRTDKRIKQARHHVRFQELAEQYRRLLLWSHTGSGKTSQLSIGLPLYRLGRDPSLRIGIFGGQDAQVKKISRSISDYITYSHDLHDVFPDLVPGPVWAGDKMIVKRPGISKDYSIQVSGITAKLHGSRLDLAILDDVLNFQTAYSDAERTRLWEWFNKTIIGRMDPDHGQILIAGNAFHPMDFMHRLERMKNAWHAERFPIVDQHGNSMWPEYWSQEAIAQRQREMSPEEWAREMLCLARDDASSRFKTEYIQQALNRGNGLPLIAGFKDGPPINYRAYTGVDLATKRRGRRHDKTDLTVLFTILLGPDESRRVLEIQSGRWGAPEIVDRIINTSHRFKSHVVIESVGAQLFIDDIVKKLSAVPTTTYDTNKRTHSDPIYGIEAMAVEMRNGKWIIPNDNNNCHPEVTAWCQEMLNYGLHTHPGDRLMASFFAREGAMQTKPKIEWGTVRSLI